MNLTDILGVEQSSLDRLPLLVKPLLEWFSDNARQMDWRDNPDPYWVWVSEIMLQQTRVEAVRGYFTRFVTALPTIQDLAKVSENKLLKLWEGLGYYTRARNLKKAAVIICEDHHGRLPADYDQLIKLPGIGEYTAGAIASIVFGIRVPSVDGNVYRVISRLLASYAVINTTVLLKKAYVQVVGELIPPKQPGQFNQALMELGATICLPNGAPRCEICPIQSHCKAYELEVQAELPVRPKKKPRKKQDRTILIVTSPLGVLLSQRGKKGLLASLWEPINLEGHLSLDQVGAFLEEIGLVATNVKQLEEATHIFTHLQWQMHGYHVEAVASTLPKPYEWVDDLSNHSIPTAFREYTKGLAQRLSR